MIFFAMLCVEFSQVQYIDLGEIAHVFKSVADAHLHLSMIFVASHFLSAKVVPNEWRLTWVSREPQKVPLSPE